MNANWVPKELNLVGKICLYLMPAFLLLVFTPAMMFSYFEGWDYFTSVYYCFITLTTIGKKM